MIRINGIETITNDVNDDIRIDGMGTFKGNVHSQKIVIDGTGNFSKNVSCNELIIDGACTFKDVVKAEKITIDGACNFDTDVEVTNITINGACKSFATINSEDFKLDGVGNFNEICGERVEIESYHKITKIKSIEATHVSVYGVKCDKISGDEVTIKGSSEVDTVEYRNKLVLSRNVTINKIIRL